MIAAGFHIVPAHWPTDAAALRGVRDAVFIREQQISAEDEWDDLDAVSRHVLALALDGNAIGVCAPDTRAARSAKRYAFAFPPTVSMNISSNVGSITSKYVTRAWAMAATRTCCGSAP
ncbi:GCN5-related N-acetyltransferase, partial [mine drainage metagenome]